MFSKSVCSFLLYQGTLCFLHLLLSKCYDYRKIFISPQLYEKNCLNSDLFLCDGYSPERPANNFYTALNLLIEDCSTQNLNETAEQNFIIEIIFLDDVQDAGNLKEAKIYDLSKKCQGLNLILKSNASLSVIRFSSINFLVIIPRSLYISKLCFILISMEYNTEGNLEF